jgi:hypothetical protein
MPVDTYVLPDTGYNPELAAPSDVVELRLLRGCLQFRHHGPDYSILQFLHASMRHIAVQAPVFR